MPLEPTPGSSFGASALSYTGGSGSNLDFQVSIQTGVGAAYQVQIQNGGTGFNTADVIVCSCADLGGSSPANDLYLRVVSIDGTGRITDVRAEGADESTIATPYNGGTFVGKTLTVYNGSGAVFDVTNDGSSYSVALDTAGNDYISGQSFTIAGTALGGTSPTNDATITVDSTF